MESSSKIRCKASTDLSALDEILPQLTDEDNYEVWMTERILIKPDLVGAKQVTNEVAQFKELKQKEEREADKMYNNLKNKSP